METARAAAAEAIYKLGAASTSHKGELLETAEKALTSGQQLFEEFVGELEKLAENGGEVEQRWVCRLYQHAAGAFPSAKGLVSGLEVATQLLAVAGASLAAVQTVDASLRAFFQEGERKLRFDDEALWAAFHPAWEAVAEAATAGDTATKVAAVRLLGQVLLLLTSPMAASLGLPSKQIPVKVQSILKLLLGWLRGVKSEQQPSCVGLAAMQAASHVVLSRPVQAGRVLPNLLSLASSSLQSRGVTAGSMHKSLKRALLALLASPAPGLEAWKPKLREALKKLGLELPAEATQSRALDPRMSQGAATTPTLPQAGPPPLNAYPPGSMPGYPMPAGAAPLDPRLQPSPTNYAQQVLNHAAQNPQQMASYPQQVLQQAAQVPQSTLHNAAPLHQVPNAPAAEEITSPAEINQILAIVAALVAENDHPTCVAFVNGLSPAVLADAVITKMADLPRKEDMQEQPAGEGLRSGNALLAGLMKATTVPSQPGPAPQTQQQALPQQQGAVQQPADAGAAVKTEPGRDAAPQDARAPTPPAAARAPAPPAPAAPALAKIELLPPAMTGPQMGAARDAALQRLVQTPDRSCQKLRSSILAHMSPLLKGGVWPPALLEDILARREAGGYDLAIQSLCAVFSATSLPTPPQPESQPLDSGKGDCDVAMREADASSAVMDTETAEGSNTQGGGGSGAVKLSGAYTSCLSSLIEAYRSKLPPKDRSLARLLVDVPALPPKLLVDVLEQLTGEGGERATLALIAARDVVLMRPANRPEALQTLLGLAVTEDADIRGKAVRLVANKLLPEIVLAPEIERFATEELHQLTAERPAKRIKTEDHSAENPGDVPEEKGSDSAKRPRPDTPEDGGVGTEAGGAGVDIPASKRRRVSPSKDGSRQEGGMANGAAGKDADAEGPTPNGSAAAHRPDGAATAGEEPPEVAARHCELYCALCTKHHALLRELFATFGRAKGAGRAAILRNAEGLAKVLGPSAPALIALVDDPPPGSLNLLLRMLNFLTETQQPPQVLVEACKRNFQQSQAPGVMVPALAGLPKEETEALLPKLLDPLPLFGAALTRILMPLPSGESGMTPTELLLALHSIDPARAGVRLKQVMVALDDCLARRQIFGKEVLASTLQQLDQRATLPPLYMRFLMQSQAAVPDLRGFMLQQLASLVSRQIWTNKVLFTGWNLAVRQNVPDSFPAFLQLPTRVLSETLESAPAEFKAKLQEYARSPSCPANQRGPITRLLEAVGPPEAPA